MTLIGVAGDWHMQGTWAIMMLKKFHHAGIDSIYHLGDFGVYGNHKGQKYLKGVSRQLKLYGQTLYITAGNHEDYDYLETVERDRNGIKWVRDNIAVLPRGYRVTIDGQNIVSLGGAASIDFLSRKEGKDWWSQEAITSRDLFAVAAFGFADIMFSHEAPLGVEALEPIKKEGLDTWEKVELEYANHSQKLLTMAVETVVPKMLFHGHFHHSYKEDVLFHGADGQKFTTSVHGLNMNHSSRNIGVLDVGNLAFHWLN